MAREAYDLKRKVHHANLGPYAYGPLEDAKRAIEDILDDNRYRRGTTLPLLGSLDALPGTGKTTLALAVGAQHHRETIARRGERTADGHTRIPTCYLTLGEGTGTAKLNGRALRFLEEPRGRNEQVDAQTMRIITVMRACEVTLMILDDADNLTFHPRHTPFLKDYINQTGATVLLVGFSLRERGIFAGISSKGDPWVAQLGQRMIEVPVGRPDWTTKSGRSAWLELLMSIERDVVLVRGEVKLTTPPIPNYLYLRCEGRIEPLMNVLRPALARLVTGEGQARSKPPRLTVEDLHRVPATTDWKAHREAAWRWVEDSHRRRNRGVEAKAA